MLRNLFRNFEGFFSQKVIHLKAITATCSALAFQWGHASHERSREEASASAGDFSSFLAFFKAGTIIAVRDLMLAVSENEIWISNQTFPELGLAERGQDSGCAIGNFRGLSIITSENISPYNLPGFCIVRWFFPPSFSMLNLVLNGTHFRH